MASIEYYTTNIQFNGQKVDLNPSLYSFAISDSIYSLYASGFFTLQDETGFLQEYLTTTPGQELGIEFGAENTNIKAPYTLISDRVEEITHPGLLNGPVEVSLLHAWFSAQQVRSTAYKDKIANVVKKLVSRFNFSGVDIDDTGNNDYWYQPLITDAKFLNDILLPYAYAVNSDNTPFYSFVTTDNIFHFKHYKSLLNQSIASTIDYKVEMGTKKERKQSDTYKKTQEIKRYTTSLKDIWKYKNREIYSISRSDGSLIAVEDLITSHPPASNLSLPIAGDASTQTGFLYVGKEKEDPGTKENLKGWQINEGKKSMFTDRFICLLPFHPKLQSGKAIQLNIFIGSGNQTQLSKRYSGKYIIENCDHVWNGEENQGYTKIIVGRKYVQIPNTYNLKATLL